MTHFIKPEYLVSLYLILNKQEEVSLKDLCNYGGKLNKELKENNIEAMFLYSDNYIEEMLERYSDYFLKGTYTIYYAIKRKVSNEVLSEKFTAYLSNDVLKVISELHNKEKKMTTKEKIKIMQAFAEGKEIQSKAVNGEYWGDDTKPTWDWNHFEYRIKLEPTYRPYKSIEEMYEDIKKRYDENYVGMQHLVFSGMWLKQIDYEVEEMIAGIDPVKSEILLGKNWNLLKNVFEHYTYLDGTPFGIKE